MGQESCEHTTKFSRFKGFVFEQDQATEPNVLAGILISSDLTVGTVSDTKLLLLLHLPCQRSARQQLQLWPTKSENTCNASTVHQPRQSLHPQHERNGRKIEIA